VVVLGEYFCDQVLGFVSFLKKRENLVHYVRDDVPVLVLPFHIKKQLRTRLPPGCQTLLNFRFPHRNFSNLGRTFLL